MPTPPASSETVTYGWSTAGRPKYYHKAIEREPYFRAHNNGPLHRAKCDRASWLDQYSTKRPAHLKPCPRCFKAVG